MGLSSGCEVTLGCRAEELHDKACLAWFEHRFAFWGGLSCFVRRRASCHCMPLSCTLRGEGEGQGMGGRVHGEIQG